MQVNAQDEEDNTQSYPLHPTRSNLSPNSPPPSFRSRSSSPSSRRLLHGDPIRQDEDDNALADAFGSEDDSDDEEEPDDRQRLMRANPDPYSPADNGQTATSSSSESRTESQDRSAVAAMTRRPTILPSFTTLSGNSRSVAQSNDGVFANLAAKPERGEKNEDLPPVSDSLISHTIAHGLFKIGC